MFASVQMADRARSAASLGATRSAVPKPATSSFGARDTNRTLGNQAMLRLLSSSHHAASDFDGPIAEADADVPEDLDGGTVTAPPTDAGAAPQPPPDAGRSDAPNAPEADKPDAGTKQTPPTAPPTTAPLAVTFDRRVRAATTPAAMVPDRIPPRVDCPVGVTVAGTSAAAAPVTVRVDGSGGTNGTVTVNGAASATAATGTSIVQLRGTVQTAPGSAGNLRLVAETGSQRLSVSPPFSVAAIMQDMVLTGMTPATGSRRGIVVTETWSSDSTQVADLDQVQKSEVVEATVVTGIFTGHPSRTASYIPAVSGGTIDRHRYPTALLTGVGTEVSNQTQMFKDDRTGVTDIPMRNSGYVIRRDVIALPPGSAATLQITTSKTGAAVTAFGVSSGAGSGAFSLPQNV